MEESTKIKKVAIPLFTLGCVILDVYIFGLTARIWVEVRDNPIYDRTTTNLHTYVYTMNYCSIPYNNTPYIYPKGIKGDLNKKDAVPTIENAVRMAKIVFTSMYESKPCFCRITSVSLVANSYWVVTARLTGVKGSCNIYGEIQKKDARIRRIILE